MGRDREMTDLHNRLQQADRVAIAAVGMGGVGKTTLARRYAKAYQSEYSGGIWWVSAGSIVTEVLGYVSRLGWLEELDPKMDEAAIVQHYLARWQEKLGGSKLLVLDNVEDYGVVKRFLPQAGAFRVLMTTRVKMQHPVSCLELGVLEIGDAIALLRRLMDDDRRFDQTAAIALCEWLGRLPLAIELVGRYLAETGTIASVLVELKAKSLAARAIDAVPEEMNYERNVAAAIDLSWQPLDERARRVLGMVSVFAIAPVELGWVRDCLPEMEDVEAILDRVLVKRSLLEKREGRYQMHALVREFVGMRREGDLGGRFVRVMTGIARRIQYPVTVAVQGRVREAVPQMEEVAAQWTEGLADEDKTWCCAGLAWFYQSLSLWQEAERCLARSLVISKSQLGPDHPSTAASLNNLAALYRVIGRYGEAEPLYERALAINEAQLGPDHPTTATSLNNLAELYRSIGRYGEAEPLYERALAINEAQLGSDHPTTATSLNNLAELYRSIGRYGEAEPLFVRALAIREAQLGPDHSTTATSLNDLAGLYESLERYDVAEPLYERALAIREARLGPDHPDTAQSLNNLAALYSSIRRYEAAEPLYERALAIREVQLGADHPDTAQSLNNLAALYSSIRRYEEAEPLYERALAIREAQLGPDHPDTAQSLNNLAIFYAKMQQYDRALPLLEQALSIWRSVLPAGHPDILSAQESLVNVRRVMFGQQEAGILLAIPLLEKALGPNHPITQAKQAELAALRGQFSEL